MSFVHFPLNIQGCFIEQKVKKIQEKHCWGELKQSAKLFTSGRRSSFPPDSSSTPPSFTSPHLPPILFFSSVVSTSLLTVFDSCLCSLSLSPCEAVNASLFLYESAIQSIALLLYDRWQWSIIPSVNVIQQHQLTLLSCNTPYWWAPSRCNYTFFKLFLPKPSLTYSL